MSGEAGGGSGRDTSRPLPLWTAARGVFDLALQGMVWSRRSFLMALLLVLPVVFGVLYRVMLVTRVPPQLSPFDLYAAVAAVYYVRNLLPLAALFYATALIAELGHHGVPAPLAEIPGAADGKALPEQAHGG